MIANIFIPKFNCRELFLIKTASSCPGDMMVLNCEGLYRVTCKRVRDDEAIGQAGPFSLISALQEGYFTDVIIKSSDSLYVRICYQ